MPFRVKFKALKWHICNVAAVAVDRLVCGIYNTISAEAMEYKLEHVWADISALEVAEHPISLTR